jgi:hypothetical protein
MTIGGGAADDPPEASEMMMASKIMTPIATAMPINRFVLYQGFAAAAGGADEPALLLAPTGSFGGPPPHVFAACSATVELFASMPLIALMQFVSVDGQPDDTLLGSRTPGTALVHAGHQHLPSAGMGTAFGWPVTNAEKSVKSFCRPVNFAVDPSKLTQAHSGVASRFASFGFADAFCPTPHAVAMAWLHAAGLAAQYARHSNPEPVSSLNFVHSFKSFRHVVEGEVEFAHVWFSVYATGKASDLYVHNDHPGLMSAGIGSESEFCTATTPHDSSKQHDGHMIAPAGVCASKHDLAATSVQFVAVGMRHKSGSGDSANTKFHALFAEGLALASA